MSAEPTPRRAATPAARGGRSGLIVAGVILLVVGIAALAWSSYVLVWGPRVDPQSAATTVADLRGSWGSPSPSSAAAGAGEAVAVIRIPALGDAAMPVLVGTDADALASGVGWYDGTAAPGAIGTFAVAAWGDPSGPWAGFGNLGEGDVVIVETREATYTYTLQNAPAATMVADTDTWVLQPVPGQPEVAPTQALITLTTTHDVLRPSSRMVAFGVLTETVPR